MEKPRVVLKNAAAGYLLGGMLLLVACLFGMVHGFSPSETQPGEIPTVVMIVFFVVFAVAAILYGRAYTVLDENGILWSSDFGEKRISWSQIEQIGISSRWYRQHKYGVIVLHIAGKKKDIPYTKSTMRCVHFYYGQVDYDHWNKEPEML